MIYAADHVDVKTYHAYPPDSLHSAAAESSPDLVPCSEQYCHHTAATVILLRAVYNQRLPVVQLAFRAHCPILPLHHARTCDRAAAATKP